MAPTKSNTEVPWTPIFCQASVASGTVRKNVTKSLAKISAAKLVFFKMRKKGLAKRMRVKMLGSWLVKLPAGKMHNGQAGWLIWFLIEASFPAWHGWRVK